MVMQYTAVNIRAYMSEDKATYIGEQKLNEWLLSFSCPVNHDVEHFLQCNAVEFTKKNQSVTYLVLRNDNAELAGYFSLALKPVSIRAEHLSKSAAKKLSRVSVLNEENNTYTASAYLIAQLGKNFALPEDMRINGTELLETAIDIVRRGKYFFGGVIAFLECENVDALMNFYTRNGFKYFNSRITSGDNPHKLNQLLKLI